MGIRHVPSRDRGSGLIIVLWVIALLSLLVAGFAFDMHVEARIISYYRKRLKAEYLAQAGMEHARMLMERCKTISGVNDSEEDKAQPWYNDAKLLKHGSPVVGITDELGEGIVILDLIPEPGRRNVNALTDEDWERILKVGGIPEELWSGLIDCYNDWRDPDDQPNVDGAETDDYYARLEPPYKARGHKGQAGSLASVEELEQIKGFTHPILCGPYLVEDDSNSPPVSGIADLLTANPDVGSQVNVNAASWRVLMTLPGITETIADAIIAEREGLTEGSQNGEDHYFTDANDFFTRVTELGTMSPADRARLNTLVSTVSQVFRITSIGRVHGVEYKITSVVRL